MPNLAWPVIRGKAHAFARRSRAKPFRVSANEHPDIELVAMHAVPEVQQMIRRAETVQPS